MNLKLHSGVEVYLDGLIIECILSTFRAADLATLSQVCHAMRAPAQLAAHRTLVMLIKRMQATLLRHLERGSWIAQLRDWEAIEATNLLWLQAGETSANLVPSSGEDRLVQSAADLSGHGHVATMHHEMPVFRPDAVNGLPAFEFEGNSVLKTKPFAQPLPQPITIVVVAKARGDTTIFDSLGSSSSRFELCHGYPTGWHPSPEVCITASGQDSSPRNSLRGSTRGTGEWHVYTTVFDHRRSEIYVDGYCEASGKSAGGNGLDGLSLGCDHNGVFFLNGSIAEVRLFHAHLPAPQRVQIEAALARRYGISYSFAMQVPSPPGRGSFSGRFSCAPRSQNARTSASF